MAAQHARDDVVRHVQAQAGAAGTEFRGEEGIVDVREVVGGMPTPVSAMARTTSCPSSLRARRCDAAAAAALEGVRRQFSSRLLSTWPSGPG
jgi:hypothetical protein